VNILGEQKIRWPFDKFRWPFNNIPKNNYLDQKDHVVAHGRLQGAGGHVDEALRGRLVLDGPLHPHGVGVLESALHIRGRDHNQLGRLVGREGERDHAAVLDGQVLQGQRAAAVRLHAHL